MNKRYAHWCNWITLPVLGNGGSNPLCATNSWINMTDYELRKLARYIAYELKEAMDGQVDSSEDRFLDISEAAKELRLSTSYLRNNHKDIPHKKVGKRILFSQRELHEYINGSKN